MCRPTVGASTKAGSNGNLFMFSVKSYSSHGGLPTKAAQFSTAAVLVLVLVLVEQTLRFFFASIQDMHPILEEERNRNVLARHIGVDFLGSFSVAVLGWKARHIIQDVVEATIGGNKNAMPEAYESRMFTYQPEGERVCVFFLAYVIKNTYDTFLWDDGMLFIIHHILTIFTTWGGLQGNAHFFAIFFFGISEISTGVLCLLANFDDEFGVPGLAEAFPMTKIIIGALFAFLFVVCRAIMWSIMAYYYCRDVWNVLKSSDPRAQGFKLWFRFTFFSLAILSLLQVIWLVEIVRIGKEELEKIGLF